MTGPFACYFDSTTQKTSWWLAPRFIRSLGKWNKTIWELVILVFVYKIDLSYLNAFPNLLTILSYLASLGSVEVLSDLVVCSILHKWRLNARHCSLPVTFFVCFFYKGTFSCTLVLILSGAIAPKINCITSNSCRLPAKAVAVAVTGVKKNVILHICVI